MGQGYAARDEFMPTGAIRVDEAYRSAGPGKLCPGADLHICLQEQTPCPVLGCRQYFWTKCDQIDCGTLYYRSKLVRMSATHP